MEFCIVSEFLKKPINEIDACVFSSDLLFDDDNRKLLKAAMERWRKELETYENDDSLVSEIREEIQLLCKDINAHTGDQFCVEEADDWITLSNGEEEITQGNDDDIVCRLRQIAKENGI